MDVEEVLEKLHNDPRTGSARQLSFKDVDFSHSSGC